MKRLKFLWLMLGLSAISAFMVNCTDDNPKANVDASEKERQVEEQEVQLLDVKMDIKRTESFDGDTNKIEVLMPNSKGGYDVFSIVEKDKHGYSAERILLDYKGSSEGESIATLRKREVAPMLSVYKTENNNLMMMYYYEDPTDQMSQDVADLENNIGKFYMFRYGWQDEPWIRWGHHVIAHDTHIERLSKKLLLSIVDTRAEVHKYYFSGKVDLNDNYGLIFKEWAHVTGKMIEEARNPETN